MNDASLATARRALIAARRSARLMEPLPADAVPRDLDSALRLQYEVASALGEVRGWKISGLDAGQQAAMGVECPLSAPLLAPWVRPSGVEFACSAFIRPRLECEFAFELGADLPARPQPYTRAEIEAAIAALRVVVEVVDSRLPAGSSPWLELADDLNNGAFIVGPATVAWQALRFAEQAIVLRHASAAATTEMAHGTGGAVLGGDPLGAVLLLANLPRSEARSLRAGQVVTTGSCTGAVALPGTGDFEADFEALGSVRFRFVA